MLGYYKVDEERIKKLPENCINIEDNIYNLCCPLIIGEPLTKDLEHLYNILEIPVINIEDFEYYDESQYASLGKKVKSLSEYLKLNKEIETLEEGSLGHTLRVGRHAYELCKLIGLPKEDIKKIYIASILHDVGKIEVPKKIISKPGKLTDKEFEIMKTHSENARHILDDFLDDETLEIIIEHHERCDKSGYPKGIVPNLGAKILGIADSYDAMLSTRVYKKQKTLKATLEELVRCSLDVKDGGKGKLYDEELVRKFVSFHGYKLLSTKYNK